MNIDEKIAVITAYHEGKKVMARTVGTLEEFQVSRDGWDFENTEYWVKPEPREWYMDKESAKVNTVVSAYSDTSAMNGDREIIKVREVIQ